MKKITICTDCGGYAVVEGDPEDYRVMCLHCDPRGLLIKRVLGHPEDVEDES